MNTNNTRQHFIIIFIALCSANCNISNANSNTNDIDEVNVNTSKIEQKISQSLPTSYAIDINTYKQNTPQALTLNDVLKQQQGIEIKQLGGAGTQSSIFTRGAATSQQTLLMLDGIPINSLSNGGVSIERLSLNHIARAEALLGAASSLYGSQAMGGIIALESMPKLNVSSQKIQQYYPHIAFKLGSHNTREINTGFSASHYQPENTSILSYGLNLSNVSTDGINAMNQSIYPNSNSDKDGYTQKSTNTYLQYQHKNYTFGLQAGRINTKGEYDSAWDLSNTEHRYFNQFSHIGVNYTHNLSDVLKAKFKLGFNENNEKDFTDNTPSSNFINQNKYASTQFDYQFLPQNTLSLQIEGLQQTLDSDTNYEQNKRSTYSARLGYVGKINQHSLQANMRLDKVTNIDSNKSYFLGYGYQFTPRWKAFATYATGFRAPNFNELYYPYYGNPKLNPEYNTSIEAGIQYTNNNVFLRTSLYQSRYQDLITYDNQTNNLDNINKAKIMGIEQSVRFKYGATSIHANINWQQPQQKDIQGSQIIASKILSKANLFANAGIERTMDVYNKPLSIGANMHFTSSKLDYPKQRLSAYALFNLDMRYQLSSDIAFQLGVTNVFNRKNIQDAYGYNKAGRTIFTQISFAPSLK